SARSVGTVKAIAGNTITLTNDAGSEITVTIQDTTRLLRISPGQKDLKDAATIQLQDIQPGDRILVRGKPAGGGTGVFAISIVAMKKTDIAEQQAREREEWQKHGVGGLVSAKDVAASSITITTAAMGDKKSVVVHASKDTVLRRYAPDSIKFDDAKAAPLGEIRAGDQLRARGVRSADGGELAADEIVSGSFRNIAGTISGIDTGDGTIRVMDLATKTNVTVKITAQSQLRKLPPPIAQRIAARLKGGLPDAATGAPAAAAPRLENATPGGLGGAGRGGGPPELQQMINRLPAGAISDLQKGDAVMLVATQGAPGASVTAITLLSGVEPILVASPKEGASTILSPWSLNSGGGEGATP
ncbi:MAG: DUF5666 domain-containing protein, partial [Candidatus Acidiferrum sp.]